MLETFQGAVRETTCPPCALNDVPEEEWRARTGDDATPFYTAKAVNDARFEAARPARAAKADVTGSMLGAMIVFHETVAIHEPDQTLGLAFAADGTLQARDTRRERPRPMPPIAGCLALCLYKTVTGECTHPIPRD